MIYQDSKTRLEARGLGTTVIRNLFTN